MKNTKGLTIAAIVVFIVVAGVLYGFRLDRVGRKAAPSQAPFFSEVALPQEEGDGNGGASPAPATDVVAETIFVHVCGEVMEPGVYELPPNARVRDVVELAGGFTRKAATDALNLALPLSDGQQVDVPDKKEAKGGAAQGAKQEGETLEPGGGLVNINTAGKEELMTLTGIGEAKAAAILAYREENGSFQAIEDVMKITGIKEGVFHKIREQISVR